MQIDREGYEKLRESAEKWVEFEGPTIGYSPHPHREELESLLAQFQIGESDLSPLEALADEWENHKMPTVCDMTTSTPDSMMGSHWSITWCGKKLRALITKMKGE